MRELLYVLQVLVVLRREDFFSALLGDEADHTAASHSLSGAFATFCAFSLPAAGPGTDSIALQQQAGKGFRGRCLEIVAPVILSMTYFPDSHGDADCLASAVELLHQVYCHLPARRRMLSAAAATIEDLTSCLDAQGMAPAAGSSAEELKVLQAGAGGLQIKLAVASETMVKRCYIIPGLQLERARQLTGGASEAADYSSAVEAAGSADRRQEAATLQLCWRLMAAVTRDFGADTLIQHDSITVPLHHILEGVLQYGVYESLHALRCSSNHAAGVQLHEQACASVWLLVPVVSAMAGAWMQCEKELLPFLPEMLKTTAATISAAANFVTLDEIRY